jgi:hypothetical protein
LQCLDCPKKYIGQTGRTFKIRYKEHLQAIRNNRPDTGYSRHILDFGHTNGNIEKTLTVLRKANKGKFLNNLEKYYIFLTSKTNTHMNEFGTELNNPIYKIIYQQLREYPHRQQHTTPPFCIT